MNDADRECDVSALDSLLEKVHRNAGYDFRSYKRGTVTRRLTRRLHATGSRTYLEYMRFLDACSQEYQKLADDLTIKVSSFFRSPYSFQQVTRMVLPELLAYKESRGETGIKVWSTACARGEEPYSIAIMLAEFLSRRWRDFNISIYATDISQWALREAQAGIYTSEYAEALSPGILKNYFIKNGQSYEAKADIRQMVRFSYFDLTSTAGPLFAEMDCIFCCNVLIYLQKQLQEEVLDMVYDSLATPGYLVLGEVETLTSNFSEKLECIDSKAKIYKKVNN